MHPLGVDPGCNGFIKTSPYGDRELDLDGDGIPDPHLHNGVDLAKEGGCWINAIADGVVTFIESDFTEGTGYAITIDHGAYKSTYWHGAERPLFSAGDQIGVSQRIMIMGSTGLSTGIRYCKIYCVFICIAGQLTHRY